MKTSTVAADDRLFLKLSLRSGLLTRPQAKSLLDKAQQTQRSPAELALREGLLGEEQVERIQQAILATRVARLDRLYARILKARQLVSSRHIKRALAIQKEQGYQVRLGELLVRANLMSMTQHAEILRSVLEALGDRGFLAPPSDEDSQDDSEEDSQERSRNAARERDAPSRSAPAPSARLGRPSTATPSARITEISQQPLTTRPKKGAMAKPVIEIKSAPPLDEAPAAAAWDRQTRKSVDRREANDDPLARLLEMQPREQRSKSVTDTQRQFLASAMELAFDDQTTSDVVEQDRVLLEGEVKVAEEFSRSGIQAPAVLDDMSLGATGAAFQPEEYFRRRRQARLARSLGMGIGGLGLLLLSVGAATALANASSLTDLRERAEIASREPDARQAFNRLVGIRGELESLGSWGVDAAEREALLGFVEARELESELRNALDAGNVADARGALDRARELRLQSLTAGRDPGRLGITRDVLAELERRVRFEARWLEAQRTAATERWESLSRAVLIARDAARFAAPDDARPNQLLADLQRRLEGLLRNIAEQPAGSPGDSARRAWDDAHKDYVELFGEDAPVPPPLRSERVPRPIDVLKELQSKSADEAYKVEEWLALVLEQQLEQRASPSSGVATEYAIATARRLLRARLLIRQALQVLSRGARPKAIVLLQRARREARGDERELARISTLLNQARGESP